MAEELTTYLFNLGIRCRYIHSDVVTLERVEILNQLREGEIDVLIGVNLLREGLDLPEVSLVAIFDADKEGFLRSERSLTQTAGRAARNVEGKVIMYADTITKSMQKTIDETNRRRLKQIDYNIKHHITPKTVRRSLSDSMTTVDGKKIYAEKENSVDVAADPIVSMMPKEALEKTIETTRKKMEKAAADLDFINAARYRDELKQLTEMLTAIKK
jgi:excinuclease ABC subunit B